jgi:hypothetical protein
MANGDAEREPDEDLEIELPVQFGKLHVSSFQNSTWQTGSRVSLIPTATCSVRRALTLFGSLSGERVAV